MAKLEDVIQRGTNAARPAATAVAVGTLYYDTTNGTLDRSNGSSWETVEGAGSDPDAIHDNVAGEIAALTLVTAASADHVLIEDASDSNNKKRVAASDFLSGGGGSDDPFGFGFCFTADPGYASSATENIGQNVCRYMRVIGGATITSVGMHVLTSAGNIAVAHYSNSGSGRSAVPGTRQATTGSIACPAVGWQTVSLSTTIAAGDWLAISTDSTTAAIVVAGHFSAAASALAAGRAYAQASAHPCPATPSGLDAGNPITRILVGVP